MSSQTPNLTPQLHMLRPQLDTLPAIEPPDGYAVRHFRTGDEAAWVQVINASFGNQHEAGWFYQRLGDGQFRPERVWFVTCGDRPVATASAWYRAHWGERTGAIHMVGALPEHSGRGLGRLVCIAALHQLRREGRQVARLTTDDFRVPAIRTYLGLDFEPLLVDENQRERWRAVLPLAGVTDVEARYGALLDGPVVVP